MTQQTNAELLARMCDLERENKKLKAELNHWKHAHRMLEEMLYARTKTKQ